MGNTEPLRDLRVLVVGLGSIGIRHLTNLRQLGCRHLGALRGRNKALYKPVDLSGVSVHVELDDALGAGYDAVIVSNPTSEHMQIAQRAAESGSHLYVEKPLSQALAGTDDLVETVRSRNLVAMVGCQLRFHPNLIAIKQWLGQGSIGRILGAQVDAGEFLPAWHPWEDYRESYAARRELGGGVILTLIHEIDYLYWFFGELKPMNSVGGRSGALELDVEDHASSFLLSERERVPVFLHMDYLQQPASRKMKIIGCHGIIEWDYHEGRASLSVDGSLREASTVPENWDRNELFLSSMNDFLQAAVQGHKPRVTLEEGIAVLSIALRIKAQVASDEAPRA